MINISGGIKYELLYDMMVTNEIDYYIMAKKFSVTKGKSIPIRDYIHFYGSGLGN